MTTDQGELLTTIRLEIGRLANTVDHQSRDISSIRHNMKDIRDDIEEVRKIVVGSGSNPGLTETVRQNSSRIEEVEKFRDELGSIRDRSLMEKGALTVGGIGGFTGLVHAVMAYIAGGGHK